MYLHCYYIKRHKYSNTVFEISVGQSFGAINTSLIYNLLTQQDDCQMNMNCCLATWTLDRFVWPSSKIALLYYQWVYSVSAPIDLAYLRFDSAAQKRRYEKIKGCTQPDIFVVGKTTTTTTTWFDLTLAGTISLWWHDLALVPVCASPDNERRLRNHGYLDMVIRSQMTQTWGLPWLHNEWLAQSNQC